MNRHGPVSEPESPSTEYVLKRFAIKLGILALGALLQASAPWGVWKAVVALSGFSWAICSVLALWRSERLTRSQLNYWDESFAFALIAVAALLFAFPIRGIRFW